MANSYQVLVQSFKFSLSIGFIHTFTSLTAFTIHMLIVSYFHKTFFLLNFNKLSYTCNYLGLVIGDATDNGLRYFVKKHQEINKFQLGSDETLRGSSKCSLKGLKALMALPNLTSVEI